jgi:NADPH2:quinone reductase
MYTQLSKLVTEGKLRPTIDTVFPLSEAAAAHTKAEEGHVRGKLVLHVADIVSA